MLQLSKPYFNPSLHFSKCFFLYCLNALIEEWKSEVNKGNSALQTDLSKAFHDVPNELLTAKLH